VTVRDETEWVELVETGANLLAGTRKEAIVDAFQKIKESTIETKRLYGDGSSAEQIVSVLMSRQLRKS